MTQATIVMCQVANGFACRTERESLFKVGLFSNRCAGLSASSSASRIIAAISYVPLLQNIFKTGPLTADRLGIPRGGGRLFVLRRRSEKMVRAAPHRRPQEDEPDARDHRRLRPGRRLDGRRARPRRARAWSSSTATRPPFRLLPRNFAGKTLVGMGYDRDVLEEAGIARGRRAAWPSTSGDNTNIVAARVAKEVYRVPDVVSRIYDPQRAEIYRRYGIQTFAPTAWSTSKIVEFIVSPQLEREQSLRQRRGAADRGLGAAAPGRQADQRPRRARRDPAWRSSCAWAGASSPFRARGSRKTTRSTCWFTSRPWRSSRR